jgi:hypothetical protein
LQKCKLEIDQISSVFEVLITGFGKNAKFDAGEMFDFKHFHFGIDFALYKSKT